MGNNRLTGEYFYLVGIIIFGFAHSHLKIIANVMFPLQRCLLLAVVVLPPSLEVASSWSPCSQSCGPGVQTRRASNGTRLDNSSWIYLDNIYTIYVCSEWRVCVSPPCPVSSPSWADQLCAQQRRGHQLARWRGYVRWGTIIILSYLHF